EAGGQCVVGENAHFKWHFSMDAPDDDESQPTLVEKTPTSAEPVSGSKASPLKPADSKPADSRPADSNQKDYILHPRQCFMKSDLDSFESGFINEQPPNDGHRRNILAAEHNGVGIGLSLAWNEKGSYRVAMTQEFTNNWGQFSPLPLSVSGDPAFTVSG